MNLRRFVAVCGAVLATAVAVGVITNLPDITRYVRISRM
jgi:hypothetical protein